MGNRLAIDMGRKRGGVLSGFNLRVDGWERSSYTYFAWSGNAVPTLLIVLFWERRSHQFPPFSLSRCHWRNFVSDGVNTSLGYHF